MVAAKENPQLHFVAEQISIMFILSKSNNIVVDCFLSAENKTLSNSKE